MRVGLVGAGLVGQKRARALAGSAMLGAVADVDRARAERLAGEHPGCAVAADADALVAREDLDLVVVATTHDALAGVAARAIARGKHVLLEKPGARQADELRPLLAAARAAGVTVKVGFNHRFHPGLRRAHELYAAGAVGPLLYLRARYGHGGRAGYEREWRADAQRSGGGELLDQGIHLLDLSRWFLGELRVVAAETATWFWDMRVEDNAFLGLRAAGGQVAWLHASWTEWKNLFSFEVCGRDGKLQVDGLGGSYGTERLTHYRMKPEMGPPETTIWEYPGEDRSWQAEWAHLLDCIREGRRPDSDLEDALACLELVGAAYAHAQGKA